MKHCKRMETLMAALMLTLLLGCGPAKPPEAETTETAAPAAAEPAAPPATPVAETPAPDAPAAAPATGMVRYDAQPTGSKMRIEGTSTIHDWHMESAIIGGYLEAEADFPATSSQATVQVFTPVRSFKSSSGKRMDQVMQEHMNEAQFKRIEYKLLELKPKSAATFDATGALTIAGQTRTNTMTVTIEKIEGAKLKVSGKTQLKMTDYGVKPPAPSIAGMSLIKTGDDITLIFEWLLAQKAQ